MLKKVGRILLGVLLISLMVLSATYVIIKNNNAKSDSSGTITVVVNNMDNEKVDARRINYNKDDTLFGILNEEYILVYKDTSYGHYLTGVSSDSFKIETNGQSSWIWLELLYLKDGKSYSDEINLEDYEAQTVSSGIDGLELKNNMIFVLNERDGTHNASIMNDTISFKNTSNLDTIFHIIVYVISGLFILGIILFIIISRRSKNPITVKELCILAFMSVVLFIQEELFTFIPNFQFTFLLLAAYVCVFGYRKTSLIVLAHVLLDNMFMGSLTPIVMTPMWMGYMIYISVIWLLRNKRLWAIVLGAVLSVIIYCLLFLVVNAIFLDINSYAYWITDIPFEVMLASCTAFTLIYIFRPLSKKLNELWYKDKLNQENEEML